MRLSHLVEKPTMWFPNRSDTNRPVQLIIIIIIIIIIIKTLFHEGNTISTKLISLAALKYLQIHVLTINILSIH